MVDGTQKDSHYLHIKNINQVTQRSTTRQSESSHGGHVLSRTVVNVGMEHYTYMRNAQNVNIENAMYSPDLRNVDCSVACFKSLLRTLSSTMQRSPPVHDASIWWIHCDVDYLFASRCWYFCAFLMQGKFWIPMESQTITCYISRCIANHVVQLKLPTMLM